MGVLSFETDVLTFYVFMPVFLFFLLNFVEFFKY